MRCRDLIPLALLLTAAPALWAAPRTVLFQDGRTLEVQSVQRQQGMAVLQLEGGGRIAVPRERVANWAELDRPAPTVRRAIRPAARQTVRASRGRAGAERWRTAAGRFADLLAEAADRHDLDPALLAAVAHVESRFNPQAVSPKGAQGLLQLMPDTAKRFGVADAFDATQNLEAGARYLSWLLDRYDGRKDLALAGYNAGERAVDHYQGIPPYPETRTYVTRVLRQVDQLAGSAH